METTSLMVDPEVGRRLKVAAFRRMKTLRRYTDEVLRRALDLENGMSVPSPPTSVMVGKVTGLTVLGSGMVVVTFQGGYTLPVRATEAEMFPLHALVTVTLAVK